MNEVDLCKEMLLHSMTSKKTDRMTMQEIKSMLGMFFSNSVIKEAQKALLNDSFSNGGQVHPIKPNIHRDEQYWPHKPLVPYYSDPFIDKREVIK